MEMIRPYLNYLNIALIIIVIIVLIILFIKLLKTMKTVALVSDETQIINKHLDITKTKIAEIEKTEKSWEALGSTFVVYIILREALRYRKRYGSIGKSFTRACVRHSTQLSKIRL